MSVRPSWTYGQPIRRYVSLGTIDSANRVTLLCAAGEDADTSHDTFDINEEVPEQEYEL